MSGKQIQTNRTAGVAVDAWQAGSATQDWGGSANEEQLPKGPSVQRYVAALKRFKWLILLLTILGGAGGFAATRILVPEYEVVARVLVDQSASNRNTPTSTIQETQLFQREGFRELLLSFRVVELVVSKHALYLEPKAAKDSSLFRGFQVQPSLYPGDYTLAVNGGAWVLSRKPGVEVERGAVGDSIGRSVGFVWQPDTSLLRNVQEAAFRVATPREASRALIKRLAQDDKPTFMELRLTDPSPQRAAAILNTWVDGFVGIAKELKNNNVASNARILEGRRLAAAQDVAATENALQKFRVQTITQPNERQSITPGVELTTNPVLNQYLATKNQAEALQKDRLALQKVIAGAGSDGRVAPEAALSITSVAADPAADQLRKALGEQSEREVALRQLRSRFTDEVRDVRVAKEQLDTLRVTVVPRAAASYLAQLQIREAQLNADIVRASEELKGIPVRTIEEARLKRNFDVADAMYRALDIEAAKAKLLEAQSQADIQAFDPAVPPLSPTHNTAPVLILGAIALGLALGIGIAILLDKFDKRFRYPEQATDDLGLFVLGVVPRVNTAKHRKKDVADIQVVEAFRTIRMNLRYAADPSLPLTLTVTSPGPGDGKSLISSNIALSFAESGARTLLIDADLRRGELAKTFGSSARPGLVECLDGSALIAEVLRPTTAHENLTLIPAGARRKRAPELLATPRLSQLIAQMATEFDVVIVDSPPLGAGYDAFALGTATTNLAIVLRSGVTDRKMAAAKLAIVETLPVRVLGAILNSIDMGGVYEYYSYYDNYEAYDEAPAAIPEKSGSKTPISVTVVNK